MPGGIGTRVLGQSGSRKQVADSLLCMCIAESHAAMNRLRPKAMGTSQVCQTAQSGCAEEAASLHFTEHCICTGNFAQDKHLLHEQDECELII